jgi:uncharacterized membrane protein YgcG
MKRLLFSFLTAVALLVPSTALASGVILKVQPSTHLIAVRAASKSVALVHTPSAARLRVGQRVALTAQKLRNGTLDASSVRVVGRARTTSFRGVLLRRTSSRLVVSAAGAVITIHRSSRSTASARDGGPKQGSLVEVGVTIQDSGEIDENSVTQFSAASPGGKIEGHLTVGTGTVTVSADEATLVLKVPAGFDLTGFQDGDEVLATFAQGSDGSLTLTALSKDDSAQQADEQAATNDQGGSGDGSGSGSGGGGSSGGGDGGGSGGGD